MDSSDAIIGLTILFGLFRLTQWLARKATEDDPPPP